MTPDMPYIIIIAISAMLLLCWWQSFHVQLTYQIECFLSDNSKSCIKKSHNYFNHNYVFVNAGGMFFRHLPHSFLLKATKLQKIPYTLHIVNFVNEVRNVIKGIGAFNFNQLLYSTCLLHAEIP